MIYSAIYVRQSSEEGAKKNLSIPSQIEACKRHIDRNGYVLYKVYKDEGISGSHLARPGLQEMMKDGKKGVFQKIVIYDVSRISRRTIEANVLEYEFEKHNIKIEYLDMDGIDSTIRPIIKSVMQAFAELHSRQSSKKTIEGMIQNIKGGYSNGGRAPFGYKAIRKEENDVERTRIIIDKRVAEPLKEYFKMRLLGSSINDGKIYLESREIFKKLTFFSEMENNSMYYAGYGIWNKANHRKIRMDGSEYFENGTRFRDKKDWIIVKDHHPALISEKEAIEIKGLKKSFKQSTDILSGRVLCPVCKNVMWLHGKDRLCCQKMHSALYRAPIRKALTKYYKEKFLNPDYLKELIRKQIVTESNPGKINSCEVKLERISRRLNNISNAISKVDDPSSLLEKYDAVKKKQAKLISDIKEAQAHNISEKAIDQFAENVFISYSEKNLKYAISKHNFIINVNKHNSKYNRRLLDIFFDFHVGEFNDGSRT